MAPNPVVKTVVITPVFNDAHFMPMWFENCVDVWNPTHMIFNEGLFPTGMEDGGPYAEEYYARFTKDGRSMDLEDFIGKLEAVSQRFPAVDVSLNLLSYSGNLEHCFSTALSYGLPDMAPDDVVLRGELDTFYHPRDRDTLHGELGELEGDQGLIIEMVRTFVSPWVRMDQERIQAQAVKWGTGQLWKNYFKACHWGLYDGPNARFWKHSRCKQYHYEWVRPGVYFENKIFQIKWRRLDKLDRYMEAKNRIDQTGRIGPGTFELVREGNLLDDPSIPHPPQFQAHEEFVRFAPYQA